MEFSTTEEYSETLPGETPSHQAPIPACVQNQSCLCLCADVTRSAKSQRVLCCVCSSEHGPDLTLPAASAPSLSPQKSLPLLRRGLILNRYTGNSSLEWLRKQTGRSVFTAALTEQLGKGTVPDLSLLPFTCCWIFSLPGMQRIPLALQLLPVCVHRGAGQGKGTQWRARGHDNN